MIAGDGCRRSRPPPAKRALPLYSFAMSPSRWKFGPKPVIGLAGGIGSGKSTAARLFAAAGCAVIDADALAKAALDEPAVRDQLVAWWGEAVLDQATGRVDRRAVSRQVFDRPDELARLESLIHPRVHAERHRLREQFQHDARFSAIVEDCPLLFEKGLAAECDVTVFVDADRAVRLARLQRDRGWTAAELDRREKNQWRLDKKAELADYCLENNAGEPELALHVGRVFSQILQHQT